ncbi:MAG: outer membrane protein TolC, partial [Bradymonadia bacterium]
EQQRQQVAALESQLALLDAAEDTAGHRISVLQGFFPDPEATGVETALPALPPVPGVGVPADLLVRRPDVEAARIRAESADARLAGAIADRLPSLRLSGSAFFQATSLSNLFDQLLWSVTAGLTAPLFDGGRRGAEVERNRAVVDERIHAYLNTLLTSALEVENALALERAQSAFLAELDTQLEIAADTLLLARDQYREGVADYLRVLTAIGTLQQLEQSRLNAVRQQLAYRIQLYRALGGGWSRPEST